MKRSSTWTRRRRPSPGTPARRWPSKRGPGSVAVTRGRCATTAGALSSRTSSSAGWGNPPPFSPACSRRFAAPQIGKEAGRGKGEDFGGGGLFKKKKKRKKIWTMDLDKEE